MNFKSSMLFLNRSFDKKRLKALLLWFRLNLSEGAALKAVEILQELGFRSATQGAISLGLDDLKTPPSKGGRVFQAQLEVALAHHEHHRGNRTPVELFQHLVDTWHRTSQDLTTEVVQLFHSTERINPVYMMAFSGARGNISQVRQLVGMRGLMADPRGQIVGFPILSNFREGLTITEYFVSCYGARKGVVDTAIRTADAGYLTRRLADVSHHVVVRTTNCGTHRSIQLRDIKEGQKTILSLTNRLVGRVLAEHISKATEMIAYRNSEITPSLASKLASQYSEVAVRSPLSCSLPWGVCQLCYGWGLSEGRRVTLGEAVGIIAAQSIGEPGTQLTLRTFHTGGVFSGELLNEIRAPYIGTILFPKPLQGLLLRTPHGQIAFLTKVAGNMKITSTFFATPLSPDLTPSIYTTEDGKVPEGSGSANTIFDGKGLGAQIHSTQEQEFFIQPSTVIFVRQKEQVYQNQLLAEFSSSTLQSANDQIEITQQVLSETAGQVWFKDIDYGNRKGPGSGSLGTHFSSQKLGGLWVLTGKPMKNALASTSQHCLYPPLPIPLQSKEKVKKHGRPLSYPDPSLRYPDPHPKGQGTEGMGQTDITTVDMQSKVLTQQRGWFISPNSKLLPSISIPLVPEGSEDAKEQPNIPEGSVSFQYPLTWRSKKDGMVSKEEVGWLGMQKRWLCRRKKLGYGSRVPMNISFGPDKSDDSIKYFEQKSRTKTSTPFLNKLVFFTKSSTITKFFTQWKSLVRDQKDVFQSSPQKSQIINLERPLISLQQDYYLFKYQYFLGYSHIERFTSFKPETRVCSLNSLAYPYLWYPKGMGTLAKSESGPLAQPAITNALKFSTEYMYSIGSKKMFNKQSWQERIPIQTVANWAKTDQFVLGTRVVNDMSTVNAWWLSKKWKTSPGMLLDEPFFLNKNKIEGQLFWLLNSPKIAGSRILSSKAQEHEKNKMATFQSAKQKIISIPILTKLLGVLKLNCDKSFLITHEIISNLQRKSTFEHFSTVIDKGSFLIHSFQNPISDEFVTNIETSFMFSYSPKFNSDKTISNSTKVPEFVEETFSNDHSLSLPPSGLLKVWEKQCVAKLRSVAVPQHTQRVSKPFEYGSSTSFLHYSMWDTIFASKQLNRILFNEQGDSLPFTNLGAQRLPIHTWLTHTQRAMPKEGVGVCKKDGKVPEGLTELGYGMSRYFKNVSQYFSFCREIKIENRQHQHQIFDNSKSRKKFYLPNTPLGFLTWQTKKVRYNPLFLEIKGKNFYINIVLKSHVQTRLFDTTKTYVQDQCSYGPILSDSLNSADKTVIQTDSIPVGYQPAYATKIETPPTPVLRFLPIIPQLVPIPLQSKEEAKKQPDRTLFSTKLTQLRIALTKEKTRHLLTISPFWQALSLTQYPSQIKGLSRRGNDKLINFDTNIPKGSVSPNLVSLHGQHTQRVSKPEGYTKPHFLPLPLRSKEETREQQYPLSSNPEEGKGLGAGFFHAKQRNGLPIPSVPLPEGYGSGYAKKMALLKEDVGSMGIKNKQVGKIEMKQAKPSFLPTSRKWVAEQGGLAYPYLRYPKGKGIQEVKEKTYDFSYPDPSGTESMGQYNPFGVKYQSTEIFVNHEEKRGKNKCVGPEKPVWFSVSLLNKNVSRKNKWKKPVSRTRRDYGVGHQTFFHFKTPELTNGIGTLAGKHDSLPSPLTPQHTQRVSKPPSGLGVWEYKGITHKNGSPRNLLREQKVKTDGSFDQHIIHMIELPIVPFPYIIDKRISCAQLAKLYEKDTTKVLTEQKNKISFSAVKSKQAIAYFKNSPLADPLFRHPQNTHTIFFVLPKRGLTDPYIPGLPFGYAKKMVRYPKGQPTAGMLGAFAYPYPNIPEGSVSPSGTEGMGFAEQEVKGMQEVACLPLNFSLDEYSKLLFYENRGWNNGCQELPTIFSTRFSFCCSSRGTPIQGNLLPFLRQYFWEEDGNNFHTNNRNFSKHTVTLTSQHFNFQASKILPEERMTNIPEGSVSPNIHTIFFAYPKGKPGKVVEGSESHQKWYGKGTKRNINSVKSAFTDFEHALFSFLMNIGTTVADPITSCSAKPSANIPEGSVSPNLFLAKLKHSHTLTLPFWSGSASPSTPNPFGVRSWELAYPLGTQKRGYLHTRRAIPLLTQRVCKEGVGQAGKIGGIGMLGVRSMLIKILIKRLKHLTQDSIGHVVFDSENEPITCGQLQPFVSTCYGVKIFIPKSFNLFVCFSSSVITKLGALIDSSPSLSDNASPNIPEGSVSPSANAGMGLRSWATIVTQLTERSQMLQLRVLDMQFVTSFSVRTIINVHGRYTSAHIKRSLKTPTLPLPISPFK